MPSLRAHLILWIFRNRQFLRFRLKKEVTDWSLPESIRSFRETCEQGARRFGKLPRNTTVIPEQIKEIQSEWIIPEGTTDDAVILFVHGGGYVSGSCSDHRVHVSRFVQRTKIKSLLFEYRLAPEHPYPAALDDSVAIYQYLLEQGIPSDKICLVGDSAGGGLSLALLLALRDRQIPLPKAAVLLSPWTDLACSGDSYRSQAGKCLSPPGCWEAFSRQYCSGADPRTPLISPLYGDLHGLPPLFISVGSDEILRDDSLRFAEKAQKAGVPVTLKIGEGLFHCYPVCAPMFPEATEAMDEMTAFIIKHFS